ncbi:hypothetical protein ACFOWZ_28800 [Lentzea rhizosphaerae]|uniref:Uncharacterized protein n=1 Tax=Lentzea rhizosphaerae TaxID=2041025 RepID=A0ABV8C0I8_9PSEU
MAEAVPGLAVTTPKEFLTCCFEAARRTDGEVGNWWQPFDTYHVVAITYRDQRGTIAVLWAEMGDLALSRSPEPLPPVEFVDDVALMGVFAGLSSHYRVWRKDELERPFDPALWPHLDPDVVRHYRPQRVGDALFNHWETQLFGC